MKEDSLRILQDSIPEEKKSKGDTGVLSVDTLHNLAMLWHQGELKKLPKVPILKATFDLAIADLNRDNVTQPRTWASLFASAETLLPNNSLKQKLLDNIRKHLPATSDGTI